MNGVYTTNLYANGVIQANGAVTANGAITSTGAISAAGNITTTANIAASYFSGNGRFLTGVLGTGGSLTYGASPPSSGVSPGDVWINSNTAVLYIYFNDGLSNVWAEMEAAQSFSFGGNSATDLTAVSSNIIPVNSGVYSIGNATSQWKDLYVSSAGINVAGQIVSASGSSLQLNGANIVTANSSPTFAAVTATGTVTAANIVATSRVSTTGNVIAGVVTATGNISASYFIGNGALLTGISGGGSLPTDPVFNSVTANTTVYTANLEFTGTGPVVLSSGNDMNLDTVGQVTFSNVVSLPSRTRDQLNALGGSVATGSIAYCSNASGGACPVWFNGTSWLKIADNGPI